MPEKLNALLASDDLPVVGPVTAATLRDFADQPDPPAATQDQVEVMIGKLAMATAQPKVSDAEARERIELYWRALRDIPLADLHAAFDHLLKTARFLPTPAEVRQAAAPSLNRRLWLKFRAKRLVALHEREWREPFEMVKPEDVQALLASVNLNAGAGAE